MVDRPGFEKARSARATYTRERIEHWLSTRPGLMSVSIVLDAPNHGETVLWIDESPERALDAGRIADDALAFMAERGATSEGISSVFKLIGRFDMRGESHVAMRLLHARPLLPEEAAEPSSGALTGHHPRVLENVIRLKPRPDLEAVRLARFLEALVEVDVSYLCANPETPKLAKSGVVYAEGSADGEWHDIGSVLRRAEGRAVDLAAWRAAELRVEGIAASVGLLVEDKVFHVVVTLPDGAIERPWSDLDVMADNRRCKCGGPVPRRQGKCDACRERAKGG